MSERTARRLTYNPQRMTADRGRRAEGAGPGGSSSEDRGSSAVVGKQTLTEQVQRRGVPGGAASDGSGGAGDGRIHQIADRGMAGAGGPLPHADAIQRSFGREHDVSSV